MKKGIERRLSIGCSGYYYPLWKNAFYPQGLATSKWLAHYSSVFNSVELNGSFYRLPKVAALQKNVASTPGDFTFSVKASRYITHILRLKNSAIIIDEFVNLMETGLGNKLDKILFQLPPTFRYSRENLDLVVRNIPHAQRNVVEFREAGWWNKEVRAALKDANITFCNVSFPNLPERYINTTPCFYLRMHGVPELFKSSYTKTELKRFYDRLPRRAKEYNIYFNNTWFDAGYRNASTFKLLSKRLLTT